MPTGYAFTPGMLLLDWLLTEEELLVLIDELELDEVDWLRLELDEEEVPKLDEEEEEVPGLDEDEEELDVD